MFTAITQLVLESKKKVQDEARNAPASTIRVGNKKSGGKSDCCSNLVHRFSNEFPEHQYVPHAVRNYEKMSMLGLKKASLLVLTHFETL
ncbi:hypothetical protein RRG08_042258 [Elysia crispata]|uniref:Uncharacterized protein n=1 Tax=Elysia crispata TaxID=231223 RepID=A0AAE1ATX1_9GAST|nr:hypothetical protein RRG08_042258 [Elysia crispata]